MYIFNNIKSQAVAFEPPVKIYFHMRLSIYTGIDGSKATVCVVVPFPLTCSTGGAGKRQ
jgi:hypothetical protein